MKKNIFMYLFVFVSLIAIFQYVNTRGIFAIITAENQHLREIKEELRDSVLHINKELEECRQHRWGKSGATNPQKQILDELMQTPLQDTDYLLMNSRLRQKGFHFKKAEILNHRWIIAEFTDGKVSGQALVEYNMDDRKKLTFKEISEVVYPMPSTK